MYIVYIIIYLYIFVCVCLFKQYTQILQYKLARITVELYKTHNIRMAYIIVCYKVQVNP